MTNSVVFPTIDLEKTGRNIERLRRERGISVRQLQEFFGFEQPQAIYKWQWGKCLPSVDNLFALGRILGVPMQDILVESNQDVAFLWTNLPILFAFLLQISQRTTFFYRNKKNP